MSLVKNKKFLYLKSNLILLSMWNVWVKQGFLVVAILGAVLAFTISGVGGLALILEALYRLFQEGKIGKAF